MDDEMKEIVSCPNCKEDEYYGMLHWQSGKQYCRKCIYRIWQNETNYKWKPKKNDYTFPFYSDGVDYRK